MGKRLSIRNFGSLPNIITIGRLLLVPVIVSMIVAGEWREAFFIFVIAGVSDATWLFINETATNNLGDFPTRLVTDAPKVRQLANTIVRKLNQRAVEVLDGSISDSGQTTTRCPSCNAVNLADHLWVREHDSPGDNPLGPDQSWVPWPVSARGKAY